MKNLENSKYYYFYWMPQNLSCKTISTFHIIHFFYLETESFVKFLEQCEEIVFLLRDV